MTTPPITLRRRDRPDPDRRRRQMPVDLGRLVLESRAILRRPSPRIPETLAAARGRR